MTQGPIVMSAELAELLSAKADELTRHVEAVIAETHDHPIVQQEMRRVIGVQLIEGKYGIGANHKRLTEE